MHFDDECADDRWVDVAIAIELTFHVAPSRHPVCCCLHKCRIIEELDREAESISFREMKSLDAPSWPVSEGEEPLPEFDNLCCVQLRTRGRRRRCRPSLQVARAAASGAAAASASALAPSHSRDSASADNMRGGASETGELPVPAPAKLQKLAAVASSAAATTQERKRPRSRGLFCRSQPLRPAAAVGPALAPACVGNAQARSVEGARRAVRKGSGDGGGDGGVPHCACRQRFCCPLQ